MTFLDTEIMVGVVLKLHREHAACLAELEDSVRPFTNTLAIAETSARLTGFFKVPTDAGTELTLSLRVIARPSTVVSDAMDELAGGQHR
jgi:predicted nucleic acid-binding protein